MGVPDALRRTLEQIAALADTVASALRTVLTEAVPWFRIHPAVPHTHQFTVFLPLRARVLNDAIIRQAEETRVSVFRGWADTDLPDVAKTEVTVSAAALDWTTADVVAAARTFVSYLGTTSHGGRAG